MPDEPTTLVRSLAPRIERAIARGELSLPPLPELAEQLMRLLKSESADARAMADLVSHEPVMAAALLRLANSAAFGGFRRTQDLDEAVARLGLKQVGALVAALACRGQFSSPDPEKNRMLRTLWEHSVTCAMASGHLATLGGDSGGEAFLAGLLHDMGKLVILKSLDEMEARGDCSVRGAARNQELMAALHGRLGQLLLDAWMIPKTIGRIALHHHDEHVPASDKLLLRVQAANAIARKLGASLHPEPELDLFHDPAIATLEVSDLELATLLVDVEDEMAQIRTLF